LEIFIIIIFCVSLNTWLGHWMLQIVVMCSPHVIEYISSALKHYKYLAFLVRKVIGNP